MDEYIDRQELIKSIVNTPLSWDYPVTPEHLTGSAKRQNEILTLIDDMPAADVRENVSAKWESAGFMAVECSNCHETFYELASDNFCPNCGAKMRGNQDGE